MEKVIEYVEAIRKIVGIESDTKKPWLVKADFVQCLEFIDLSLPDGNLHLTTYELLKDWGWQLSTTLLTLNNAKILLKKLQEKVEPKLGKVTKESAPTLWEAMAKQRQQTLQVDLDAEHKDCIQLKFMESEEVEKNFPQGEIEQKAEDDKDILRQMLLKQYLKSAMRNLDLIEEIHFIGGKEITITTKR